MQRVGKNQMRIFVYRGKLEQICAHPWSFCIGALSPVSHSRHQPGWCRGQEYPIQEGWQTHTCEMQKARLQFQRQEGRHVDHSVSEIVIEAVGEWAARDRF